MWKAEAAPPSPLAAPSPFGLMDECRTKSGLAVLTGGLLNYSRGLTVDTLTSSTRIKVVHVSDRVGGPRLISFLDPFNLPIQLIIPPWTPVHGENEHRTHSHSRDTRLLVCRNGILQSEYRIK